MTVETKLEPNHKACGLKGLVVRFQLGLHIKTPFCTATSQTSYPGDAAKGLHFRCKIMTKLL